MGTLTTAPKLIYCSKAKYTVPGTKDSPLGSGWEVVEARCVDVIDVHFANLLGHLIY